ncbi:Rap1a/Tai family immunity protein [Mesorhizobium sp. PL10]
MKKAAAALLLSTFWTGTANANFFSGNQLHDFCTSSPAYARGYILGAVDMNGINLGVIDQATGQSVIGKKFICIPTGAMDSQVGDLACRYLAAHPEDRQLPAPILIYRSLLEVWKCP